MILNHSPSVCALRGWPYILCILGDSGGKVSNVGGDNISHWGKKKSSYEHVFNSEWLLS